MALPRKNTEPSARYNPTPSSGNDNMQSSNANPSMPFYKEDSQPSMESQQISARDEQNRANWAVFWVVVVLAAVGIIYTTYSQKWAQQNSVVSDNNMAATTTNNENGSNENNTNAAPTTPNTTSGNSNNATTGNGQ